MSRRATDFIHLGPRSAVHPESEGAAERRIMDSLDSLIDLGGRGASGEFGPALYAFRGFAGYTRRDLASSLTRELGLSERSAPRVKYYLADLENGRMSAERLAGRVFKALSGLLGVELVELMGGARFSRQLTRREAHAYARSAKGAPSSKRGERTLPWDEVDALFLGEEGTSDYDGQDPKS